MGGSQEFPQHEGAGDERDDGLALAELQAPRCRPAGMARALMYRNFSGTPGDTVVRPCHADDGGAVTAPTDVCVGAAPSPRRRSPYQPGGHAAGASATPAWGLRRRTKNGSLWPRPGKGFSRSEGVGGDARETEFQLPCDTPLNATATLLLLFPAADCSAASALVLQLSHFVLQLSHFALTLPLPFTQPTAAMFINTTHHIHLRSSSHQGKQSQPPGCTRLF